MGSIRTFFVFLDLPVHVEFRAPDFPLMEELTVFEIRARLENPNDPRKVRVIEGDLYTVKARKLVYSTLDKSRMGLTQYLELAPVKL